MKNDLLHSMKLDQDIARSQLWNIFTDEQHNISSLSREIGMTHASLKNFFRGDTLSHKTMIRIKQWIKEKHAKDTQKSNQATEDHRQNK